MKTSARTVIAALALAAGATNAFALSENLGTLNAAGTMFYDSFSGPVATSFTDSYSFTIASNSSLIGAVDDMTISLGSQVTVSNLSIVSTGSTTTLAGTAVSSTPGVYLFDLGSLGAGTYTLKVSGTANVAAYQAASYFGIIGAEASASVASPTPEPADFAMASLGLLGVGVWLRRSRRAA